MNSKVLPWLVDVLAVVCLAGTIACDGEESDGDGDVDSDGDSDGDADGDGDVDSDGDSDGDGDVDSDGDSDGDGDVDSLPPTYELVGWASVEGLGVETTTGGGDHMPITVTTFEELEAAIGGDEAAVVRISGDIEGIARMGSNKTLEGAPGGVLRGSLILNESSNVIVRNLRLVGYNCTDDDCGDGRDTITVYSSHHVWFDHCDVSDGTDGNLDITETSDFVTVSWSRFSYSGRRPGGHQLSNLVGASDGASGDAGHLNVTWHHNWWAENVEERMPRVRYGQNHLFNNLYTSTGNNYCVGLGVFANVLLENNVFIEVDDPINSTSYSNDESVVESRGNIYTDTSGDTDDFGSGVFTPPYTYELDPPESLEILIRADAGVPES